MAEAPGVVKRWDQLTPKEQRLIAKRLKELPETETTRAAQKTPKSTFQLKGYVRCELSSSDKDNFKLWEESRPSGEIGDMAIKCADAGYLLKLGESGMGFQASLCAASTGKPWDGLVLTAHASSALRAGALLMFKHHILMEADWSAWMEEGGEDFLR